MKAEERKHLEENELQHWLADAWATMTSGSTANTVIWGLIVLGLVVYIGWRSWSRAAETTRSAAWSQFDTAANVEGLEAIIHSEVWANTPAVLPAKYNLSRLQMQDALTRIAGPNREDREKAAKAIEEVRGRYRELARAGADEPALVQEAMYNAAKIEETLCGVPTAEDPTRPRGSLDEAVRLYRELAAKYPKSYLGEQAAKRAQEIEDRKTAFVAFYLALLKSTAPTPPPAAPVLPETPKLPVPEAPKPEAKTPEPAPKAETKAPEAKAPEAP